MHLIDCSVSHVVLQTGLSMQRCCKLLTVFSHASMDASVLSILPLALHKDVSMNICRSTYLQGKFTLLEVPIQTIQQRESIETGQEAAHYFGVMCPLHLLNVTQPFKNLHCEKAS